MRSSSSPSAVRRKRSTSRTSGGGGGGGSSSSDSDSDIYPPHGRIPSSDSSPSDADEFVVPELDLTRRTRSQSQPPSSARPRRAAASLKPGAYRIEPLDSMEEDSQSRTSTLPKLSSSIRSKDAGRRPKNTARDEFIASLIKQKVDKQAKGIDEDAFRRADALAAQMDKDRENALLKRRLRDEQAQLQDSGSRYSQDSDSQVEWSSDDDESISSDNDSFISASGTVQDQKSRSASPAMAQYKHARGRNSSSHRRERIKSVLQAVSDDPEDLDALDVIQREVMQHRQIRQGRRAEQSADRVVRFWRSGRVARVAFDGFCPNPWEKGEEEFLSLGTLKFVHRRYPEKLVAIAKWAFFLSTTSQDSSISFHALDLLDSIFDKSGISDQQTAAARSILQDFPRLFALLGARVDVLQDCFALPAPLQGPDKVERTPEHRLKTRRDRGDVPWLTTQQRTTIATQLTKAIRSVHRATRAAGSPPDDRLVGLFVSLLFLRADCRHGELKDELRLTIESLLTHLSPFSIASSEDEAICERVVGILQGRSMCCRHKVVDAIPDTSLRARQMRRWIAWTIIMEGADMGYRSAGYSPILPNLGKLAEAIDPADPQSHFYLGAGSAETNYEELCASIEILGIALTDLALQICRSKATSNMPSASSSPTRSPVRQGVAQHSRALEVALEPYHYLEPKRSGSRVTAMRAIVDKMQIVNGKIKDALSDSARTLAKDTLQRYALSVKYQTTMYAARPYTHEHHEKLNIEPQASDGLRPYRLDLDGGSVLSSANQTPTPVPFQLSPSPTKTKRGRSRSPKKMVPEAGQSRITNFLRQPNIEVVIPARRFSKTASGTEVQLLNDEVSSDTPLCVQSRSATLNGPSTSMISVDDGDVFEPQKKRKGLASATASAIGLKRRNADLPKTWRSGGD